MQAPNTPPSVSDAIAEAARHPLQVMVWGNTVGTWLIAGGTLVVLVAAVLAIRALVAWRLEGLAKRTKFTWDDTLVQMLRGVRLWLVLPALVFAALSTVSIHDSAMRALAILAMVGIAVQVLISSATIVDAVLQSMLARTRDASGEPDPALASGVGVIRVIVMVVVFFIVLLLGLDNLGFKITPLLTGLGIGGIAIALAVQSVLGDLLGSLSILFDRPFVVGDFIVVGDKMGTVEKIGIKTTRVRALGGEQLVFSNTDLLSSRVQNFKRMQERRAVFTIGIVYETPREVVGRVPTLIRESVEAVNQGAESPRVRFDRSHFKAFGPSSLDFETVYVVLSADFNAYMDTQQQINLAILERFAAEGIQFAYPTQLSIHREEDGARPRFGRRAQPPED